jgi:hypothetical protein
MAIRAKTIVHEENDAKRMHEEAEAPLIHTRRPISDIGTVEEPFSNSLRLPRQNYGDDT